jgi:hypothetical protein
MANSYMVENHAQNAVHANTIPSIAAQSKNTQPCFYLNLYQLNYVKQFTATQQQLSQPGFTLLNCINFP